MSKKKKSGTAENFVKFLIPNEEKIWIFDKVSCQNVQNKRKSTKKHSLGGDKSRWINKTYET